MRALKGASWNFFAATIRNAHTRRAYSRSVGDFLAWCEQTGVTSIAAVQALACRDLDRVADARALRAERKAAACGNPATCSIGL